MPFIAHATKTWTVFDASIIANILYIFGGFHTPPFAIIASHTVFRRVSDRSVALASSCSSESSGVVRLPTTAHCHILLCLNYEQCHIILMLFKSCLFIYQSEMVWIDSTLTIHSYTLFRTTSMLVFLICNPVVWWDYQQQHNVISCYVSTMNNAILY